MNHSETIGAIAKALSSFQGEVENAAKSSKNPFFNSKYADLGEVLNTARPLLGKNGLSLAQFPSFDGSEQGGIVKVTSLLAHESGEWMSCETTSPVFPTTGKSGKTEPVSAQTIGSATTYCRRYAAAAILGIGQEDDDGNSVSRRGDDAPPPPPKGKWTPDQETQWATLLDKIGNHLRVQNKLDELEAFVARCTESKNKFAPEELLGTLRQREAEFARQTTDFIKRTVKAPEAGSLPLED